MTRFEPIRSLSQAWAALAADPGYYTLRTLAVWGIGLLVGIIFGVVVFATLGVSFLTALASGSGPSAMSAVLGGLAIGGSVLIVGLAGLVMLFVTMMIQLGYIRSLFRKVVSGDGRYDLFAPVGRTLQYLTFGIAIALVYLALWVIIALLLNVNVIIGVLVAVVFAALFVWFGFQLALTPYRMFAKNQNPFAAAAGSYRMLAGARWAFLLTLVVVSIIIGFVSAILSLIPILGLLVLLVIDFLLTPLAAIWMAVVYQQLEPVKKID